MFKFSKNQTNWLQLYKSISFLESSYAPAFGKALFFRVAKKINKIVIKTTDKNERNLIINPLVEKNILNSTFVIKSVKLEDKLKNLSKTSDGFYVDLTKKFLADPEFIKVAATSIKNKFGFLTMSGVEKLSDR